MDADGNIQVIRAYGVEEITVVASTRLPPLAREAQLRYSINLSRNFFYTVQCTRY
jgi:hypothetical protein